MKALMSMVFVALLSGCMVADYKRAEACDGTEFKLVGVPVWRQEDCVNVSASSGETPPPVRPEPQ